MQILTFLLIINIFNLKAYTAKSSSKTSDVIDLKTSNFERKLMNYDWAFVKFCASWCTDCKNLAPDYERAASILKSSDESMVLTQIDCDNEPKICQTYKIKGYPTLKLFKNANFKSDYNGNYSTDDILNFMMNYSANLNKTSRIFNVSTSEGLKNSLNKVRPGDIIQLADGVYSGKFRTERSGTKNKKIILRGSKNAIITNPGEDGLVLYGSSYWILDGFSVSKVFRAILLEFSSFNILNNLNVSYSDTSAIRIRNNSTDNIVQYSQVSFTGRKEQHNGEAIYIGAALGHWINNLTGPDRSSRNRVFSNYIGPNVTAESVDIKEGVDNVIVENNTINGFGMEAENKALTWISVKGFNCTIRNNNGNSSVQDGFAARTVVNKITDSGCNNQFINNTCSNIPITGLCVSFLMAPKCKNNLDLNNILLDN